MCSSNFPSDHLQESVHTLFSSFLPFFRLCISFHFHHVDVHVCSPAALHSDVIQYSVAALHSDVMCGHSSAGALPLVVFQALTLRDTPPCNVSGPRLGMVALDGFDLLMRRGCFDHS